MAVCTLHTSIHRWPYRRKCRVLFGIVDRGGTGVGDRHRYAFYLDLLQRVGKNRARHP